MILINLNGKIQIQLIFCLDCPFIVKDGLKNQKVPKNSTVLLECHIVSNYAESFTFKWKKNGEPIDTDIKEKYEFDIEDNVYRLKIFKFNENDEANYEIYLSEPEDFEFSSKAKIDLEMGK